MGCGCGKGSSGTPGTPSVYIFTSGKDGRQSSYNSMYEAKFAQMKEGGGGSIRVEAKA